ncbi:MAG: iron-siderophore ABC transporter substrate-binding protein [Calothrix sp. C42_A2020_038]|nr:iron-siderophore ABC transporter substrate-binding protein [Calothrix sp. C42_A2020_038]
MKSRKYHIQLFLLVALSFLLITAGYNSQLTQKTYIQNSQSQTSDCRIIQHELGKTCVPLQAQRIIATDEIALDAILALGLKPIAAGENAFARSRVRQLSGNLEGIISIGKDIQINIEKMVQLHPDLIVGFYFTPHEYKLFSLIAPTVKLESKYLKDGWKESLQQVGEILDTSKQAQDKLVQYQQRVKQLRKSIEQKIGKVEVSVIRFYAATTNPTIETILSFTGSILQEVGFSVPMRQFQYTTTQNTAFLNVSLERLDLLDADVLFVMLNRGAEKSFKMYEKSQLWQSLKAFKNNKVYIVDSSYWYFGNILAANAILDDLFKYIIESS